MATAQTADVTEGCAPLTINFSGPAQNSYFWDFDDGASSVESAPENVFTLPGTYVVKLYEAQGGPLVGSLTITVYPDIEVEITNSADIGCVPMQVDFMSLITADPSIVIQNINWTFGDGNTGTGTAPSNTYMFGNVFDISVALETNFSRCNKTVEFPDVLEALDLVGSIILPEEIPCQVPAVIQLDADAAIDSRFSYRWDFGNGTTFDGLNPPSVTYTEFGTYQVKFITSSQTCEEVVTKSIVIGPQPILLDFTPEICVGQKLVIDNNTLVSRFDWQWDGQRSFDRNLEVTYLSPGEKEISLTAASEDCSVDTTLTITVEQPNAEFILDPPNFCDETLPLTLIAAENNMKEYHWNEVAGGPLYNYPRIATQRDSLYIHTLDSIDMHLRVVSENDCEAELFKTFHFKLPEAYFIADETRALTRLVVNFTDHSTSDTTIVKRKWLFGDGNEEEVDPGTTSISHRYDCGEYYARLVIEDANGCIDTSASVFIEVLCVTIEEDFAQCNNNSVGQGLPKFCVGDDLEIFYSPDLLDFHSYTGRLPNSHCWSNNNALIDLDIPGQHAISSIVEFKGVVLDSSLTIEFQICGARAEILYEMDCSRPGTFDFTSNSLNATHLEWLYEGKQISDEETFSYTFDKVGNHKVYLVAEERNSSCRAHMDSVTVCIPELKADFILPNDIACDSSIMKFDASASVGVFEECNRGYKWLFENQRPREVGYPVLSHQLVNGQQDVTLVVTDINGCHDTISKNIDVYGIDPNFDLDSLICLPYQSNLQDLSSADTTIVDWQWNFGSQVPNPEHLFDLDDVDPINPDTLAVELIVTDAIGCKDTLVREATIIDPMFFINSYLGSRYCLGETAAGEQSVTLVAEHKSENCVRFAHKEIKVLETPTAGFTSSVDEQEIICYPAQISFFTDPSHNLSELDFDWGFGNEDRAIIPNPTIEFGIGTHQVTQYVTNSAGCVDSLSKYYTLVGPTGTFMQDKEVICLGEEVVFSMVDTASISNFYWNFGDGNEAGNENPVAHTYTSRPLGDSTIITLTL